MVGRVDFIVFLRHIPINKLLLFDTKTQTKSRLILFMKSRKLSDYTILQFSESREI